MLSSNEQYIKFYFDNIGLFSLVSSKLFDKYAYFIDTYSDIQENEKHIIYNELKEEKESFMLTDYIKDLGRQEGSTLVLSPFSDDR